MRCLGLYCLLDDLPTSLPALVTLLREALITEEAPIRAVAAQVGHGPPGGGWPCVAAVIS